MSDNGQMPLRLEWRTPAELADNPANWRRHPDAQVSGLRAAVAEVGWAGAALFNERTGRLVDGHARKKLPASMLVDGKMPVLIGSWTEEQERVIVATLDPLAGLAEADTDALKSLLDGIETESDGLRKMLDGLATEHHIELGNAEPTPDPEPQIDRAAELQKQWGTDRSQVWIIPSKRVPGKAHKVMCGDSTKAEDVGRLMGNAKPAMMVTDPPYGVEYDAARRYVVAGKAVRGAQGKVTNDDRADWREAWALFRGDVAYVWHADVFSPVVADGLLASGFVLRALICWGKNAAPPLAYGINEEQVAKWGLYHHQHEPCWYAVRKGASGRWAGDRRQTTLWQIDKPRESETGHSTQKPLECMARPIRNHDSPEVYDPFLGSFTTIVACENLGRVGMGLEISPAYVAVGLERLKAIGLQPALSAG